MKNKIAAAILFAALVTLSLSATATSVDKEHRNPVPFVLAYELLAAGLSQWAVADARSGGAHNYTPVMAATGVLGAGGGWAADEPVLAIVGVGYLAIAAYQQRYAGVHSDTEIFRNNMIGYNLILATGMLWSRFSDEEAPHPDRRLALYVTPDHVLLNYRFY